MSQRALATTWNSSCAAGPGSVISQNIRPCHHNHPVASLLLGAIEGCIGGVQHGFLCAAMLWINGNSQRYRNSIQRQAGMLHAQFFYGLSQILSALLRGFQRGIWHDQDEFFAAIATGDILVAYMLLQKLAHFTQQRVAARV